MLKLLFGGRSIRASECIC